MKLSPSQGSGFTSRALKVEVVNDGVMNGKSIPIKIDR